MLPRNAGRRQRKTCAGCGYIVTATWTEGAIVLAAYPAVLPRRDFAPPPPPPHFAPQGPVPPQGPVRQPAGRREPRQPVPGRLAPPAHPQPQPVFVPAPGSGPDWEGARQRVEHAMNTLR